MTARAATKAVRLYERRPGQSALGHYVPAAFLPRYGFTLCGRPTALLLNRNQISAPTNELAICPHCTRLALRKR